VWAGVRAQGKTDLHIIENGSLTAVRHINKILDVHVRAVGPDFIIMDDNARAHRGYIKTRYLEEASIVRMDWPTRSTDLNPIEHAWDILPKAISSRHVQPTAVQKLRHAII
jgi:transposase